MDWRYSNPGLWWCPDGQPHKELDISPFRGWVCGRCQLAYSPPLAHATGQFPAFFLASGTAGRHLDVPL